MCWLIAGATQVGHQGHLEPDPRQQGSELDAWDADPTGALALVLLLDQFPRQIWRDSAMAFAGDPQALALSLRAVEQGWLAAEHEQALRLTGEAL